MQQWFQVIEDNLALLSSYKCDKGKLTKEGVGRIDVGKGRRKEKGGEGIEKRCSVLKVGGSLMCWAGLLQYDDGLKSMGGCCHFS